MSADSFLTVKNWERFQHYKDRNPPWIKLHFEILTSPDWVMLADADKLLAVVCMLLASRNEGKIPNNPNYFKRVAYLDKLPNFNNLINCGFLEKPLADDTMPLAHARPETYRTETETERKEEKIKFILPEWLLPHQEAWNAFMEIRKEKKAAQTPRALNSVVNEIKRLSEKGQDINELLQKSIRNSWKDIFEIKQNSNDKHQQKPQQNKPSAKTIIPGANYEKDFFNN